MKRILNLLVFFLIPMAAFSQVDIDFDDFSSQTDFDAFQKVANQRFETFVDSMNSRFAKELERQWVEFEVFQGKPSPKKPKPEIVPQVDSNNHSVTSQELPIDEIVEPVKIVEDEPFKVEPMKEDPVESAPEIILPQPQSVEMMPVPSSFYHQSVKCSCPTRYQSLHLSSNDENSVAAFWSGLSCEGFDSFVLQCREEQSKMNLNDWGLFEFVVSLSEGVFENYAEQTVLTAFLMNQLGYNIKVGRWGNELCLLVPSATNIYETPFLICDDVNYYAFSLYPTVDPKALILTYKSIFPKASYNLDLNIYSPIHFTSSSQVEDYKAKVMGQTISVSVNKDVMDFYNDYPFSDLVVYANAKPSEKWEQQTNDAFLPILEGRNEEEKVAILLSFLHFCFDYATDDKQFDREKYFFCEENFYYPFNDCEDRSILFAHLVKNLVGLDVVLLDYPEHIATAVHFNDDNISGDYYTYKNKKYIVCDPTYIGAYIGETMPDYKNVKAKLIELRN